MRIVVLALVLAAACSGPVATPSPTPPASPSPSPTVAPTDAPTATPVPSPSPTSEPSGTPPVARVEIRQIQQLTERVGFAAVSDGPGSALWKTSDAGAHWARLAVPANTRIDRLRFIDEQSGWALGFVVRDQPQAGCQQASSAAACRSVVLTTDDGGRSWTERMSIPVDPNGGTETIRELQATDALHAWVIAQSGPCDHDGCLLQEVRATSDGGRTWQARYASRTDPTIPLLLRMASSDAGWMVGQRPFRDEQRILVTADAGRTWRDVGMTLGAQRLDAASTREAWILTRDGAFCTSSSCAKYDLLHTGDGGATWVRLGNPVTSACSAGHLSGLVFASERIGYVGLDLGAGGLASPGGVMTTVDGGRTWRCVRTPPNVTVISAADPRNAWAISVDRAAGTTTLYRTADAGSAWEELPAPGP